MTKIDNIISLYKEVKKKTKFILLVSEETGRQPNTIRTHWFSSANFYSIPEECQDTVIKLLQNTIKQQNSQKIN